MIIDGRTVPRDSTLEVDICIVGSGPAGISLALSFLDRSSTTVALLESGGLEFDEEPQTLAETDVVGQAYYPVKETRIRMFGGSTISWGGIVSPLDAIDFEPRDWVPNSGWPFSRTELDPYYDRAFRLFDVDPGETNSTVDELPEEEIGGAPTPDTRWSPIYFTAPTRYGKKYAHRIADSRNVRTYLFSTATELQLNEAGGHIDGLKVRCFGGNQYRVVARTYVVAGGGIENARLLMTSNAVQKEGIGNQHDLVGRYFQEHPRAFGRYLVPKDTEALAQRVIGAAGTLRFSRLGLTDEVQQKEELLNFIVNLSFGYAGQETPQFEAVRRIVNASRPPWSDSPYYQDTGGGPNRVRWEDVKTAIKRPDRSVQAVVGAVVKPARMRRWVDIGTSVEQIPRPENRLVLTNERDTLGIPKVELHWTLSDDEERTYRRGMELVLEALERYVPGISSQRMDDPDPWPGEVLGTWHHIGTTRMHDDPTRGVVDANNRVHGVDNLYMAGSSVFPASGASAPTLTIVALALRLADHLGASASTLTD
jgi:choline dehydrogenase-like flavoprotein